MIRRFRKSLIFCSKILLVLLPIGGLFSEIQPSLAQQNLVGPILVGQPVGSDVMKFQDVGSMETWHIILPDSSFKLSSWSADGCNLLMGGNHWAIVSLADAQVREIPQLSLPDVAGQYDGSLIWSYDGKSLTLSVYFSDHDVRIYSVNLDTFVATSLLSLQESGSAVRWLSDTELLYQTPSGYYIWNAKANESRLDQNRLQMPVDWWSELYLTDVSPHQAYLTRYYSQNALSSFIRASQEIPPPEDVLPEYVSTLEAIPKVPGFDVYQVADGTIRHVDVAGQFLQFLRWSPSSDQIIVTTDPRTTSGNVNGLYIYDLKADSIQRIGDLPAMYNAEYGGYEPTWSPDSNWLAFNTPTGYVIYNLTSQENIGLSDEFDGFYMRVDWSPIMDYSKSNCGDR